MKVAILGAPGSGKTKTAKKLATAMAQDGFKRPVVIDGYVRKLEHQTGFSLDYGASYPQNYQIHFLRWTLEQAAKHKGENSITCGSIYETTIYCAIKSLITEESDKFSAIEDGIQFRAAMTALGMFETMTYEYEALFYLPYDAPTLLAKGRSYDTVIDQKLPEVLEGHRKNFVTLDGTEKANVKYAAELIASIREAQAASDDEQSVRGSGEATPEEQQEG